MGAKKKYPEVLLDIATIAGDHFAKHGWPAEKAAQAGFELSEHVRKLLGGHSIYIPKGVVYQRSERDEEICRKFTGDNQCHLAEEYNLTMMRIYQIIKRGLLEIEWVLFGVDDALDA
jgi:Mor family transcriptional regulator